MLKKLVLFVLLSFIAGHSFAGDYLNRAGKLVSHGRSVPLEQIRFQILPENWQVYFEKHEYREIPVDWNKGVTWHTALDAIGKTHYLSLILDGAQKELTVSNPNKGLSPGLHVISSTSPSFQFNTELVAAVKRARINEFSHKKKEMMLAEAAIREKQKVFERTIQRMEKEKIELQKQIGRLAYGDKPLSNSVQKERAYRGLVTANLKRLSNKSGYQSVKFQFNTQCDWIQEDEIVLIGESQEEIIVDYALNYGMVTEFSDNLVTFHLGEKVKNQECKK